MISRRNRRSFRLVEIRLKGGFSLSEMNGDYAAKFIWACAFLLAYSLAGEIFLFKIVKMVLTNRDVKNY